MSVILGIQEKDCIILVSDNRAATLDGKTVSDSLNKIEVINSHLAFSSAGNAAVGKALLIDLNKLNTIASAHVEDFLRTVESFYSRAKNAKAASILTQPFCFLVAGQGNDKESKLVSGAFVNGRLQYGTVPMALYPPADVPIKFCNECFAKNYYQNHAKFAEKTICEISEKSKFVSPSGNKWIFNKLTNQGQLYSF